MSSARSATNSAPVEAAFDARGFLATLTESPGVYRMLAADRAVLYVGKAKNLKKRVTAYTADPKQQSLGLESPANVTQFPAVAGGK